MYLGPRARWYNDHHSSNPNWYIRGGASAHGGNNCEYSGYSYRATLCGRGGVRGDAGSSGHRTGEAKGISIRITTADWVLCFVLWSGALDYLYLESSNFVVYYRKKARHADLLSIVHPEGYLWAPPFKRDTCKHEFPFSRREPTKKKDPSLMSLFSWYTVVIEVKNSIDSSYPASFEYS